MTTNDHSIEYYKGLACDQKNVDRAVSRYVPLSKRKVASDIPDNVWHSVQKGKVKTTFAGIACIKDPFCFPVYSMLIEELKPKTILENGTLAGGSALWLANLCQAMDIETHIYSLDYEAELRDPRSDHPNVTYLIGDLNEPSSAWPESLLKDLKHPILFIEDAHANFFNVLKHLEKFFVVGDYVIVEDTYMVPNLLDMGDKKALEKFLFLKDLFPEEKFLVDTKYCDWFGYNSTYNWNSFFKVIK